MNQSCMSVKKKAQKKTVKGIMNGKLPKPILDNTNSVKPDLFNTNVITPDPIAPFPKTPLLDKDRKSHP